MGSVSGSSPAAPSPSPAMAASPAIPLTGAYVFFEDFERGTTRWSLDAAEGVGWRLLNAPACGGYYSMLMGLPEQAPFTATPGLHTLTLTAPVVLTTARRPHLRFDVKGRATPPEAIALQAEVRRPGGAWEPIGAPVLAQYVLANTMVRDLTPWAGGPVELRFLVRTSPTEAATQGLYLDEVQIIEPDTR